jgi:hypothetical protein
MFFPLKYNIPKLNENYELIKVLENSGNIFHEEKYSYTDFLNSIEHCIKLRDSKLQCKTLRILAKHDYLVNKANIEITNKMNELFSVEFTMNYGIENIKTFLK